MRLSREQRRRQARAFHRLQATHERSMATALLREFNRAGNEAAAAYPSWLPTMKDHQRRLAALLQTALLRAALAGVEHSADALGKAHPTWERKLDTAEQMRARIAKWAKAKAARSVSIGRTTQARIRNAIAAGLAEQAHPREIAREIRQRVASISPARAETIARTESAAAIGKGEFENMREVSDDLGLKTVKVWTSTEDDRTRESHAEADGQRRDLDEPFIVGGAELMFPSDPDGPPQEIINCRCVATYESV